MGSDLHALLKRVVDRQASDLHLSPGAPARARIDGRLEDIDGGSPLSNADIEALMASIPVSPRLNLEDLGGAAGLDAWEFAFEIEALGRFRGSLYLRRGAPALALRRIPMNVPDFAALGMPPIVRQLALRRRGLVVVTGPTGSGKTTTLSAMVDCINRDRSSHVITVEDPIEFVHAHRRCLVDQREVGRDAASFTAALRSALRQDPDVVMIGEMRDVETMGVALEMAETGHLVLSSAHTRSAAETVQRIISAFPAERHAQVRAQLASVLEGVVAQTLVPRTRGGRLAIVETLVATPAVRAVIRDDKVHQLASLIETGRQYGMCSFGSALRDAWVRRQISLEVALTHAPDPGSFRRLIGEVELDDGPGSIDA